MRSVKELGKIDIRRVEIHPVALPLVHGLRSAGTRTETHRPVVYVRVVGADGEEGWGEGCALEDAHYSAETSTWSARVLAESLAPLLLRSPAISVGAVRRLLDADIAGWHMSKAAIEQAVLDALLRKCDMSLTQFLEARRTRVPAGAIVGFPETGSDEGLSTFVEAVRTRFAEGYKRVRIKVQPVLGESEWTVRPIKELRRAGVDGLIQPDGNMSYNADHVDLLASLSDYGIVTFEQPFGSKRHGDHAALRARSKLRLIGDESIESLDDVALALDERVGAFDGICNKWSRVGGILESARIAEFCVRNEVPLFMGGMIGVGTYADLALAATIPDHLDVVGDHGPSGRWIAPDADPAPAIEWSGPGFVSPATTAGVVAFDERRIRSAARMPPIAFEVAGDGRVVACEVAALP